MRKLLTVIVAIAIPLAAAATEVDRLIDGIKGGSEAAFVEARQFLPRQSPTAATAGLVPLVDHEDRRIAFTAKRLIEDCVAVVSVPGREEERRQVTRSLMALMAPDASERARDAGFRLIPLVLPEGYGVLPIAAWLDHPESREAARTSLAHAGTQQAREALRNALTHAEPAFQVALLDALAQFDDPANIRTASPHLLAPKPEVRVAATRVLARAGGVDEANGIRRVMRETDGGLHREAAESYAVLAERILLAGGNWDKGIAIFAEILEESADSIARGIALAGLGRFGDERAVPVILAAVDGDGGEAVEPQAVSALQMLDGEGVRSALLAAHGTLSPSMQSRMLDVYARKDDRRFLDLILAGAADAHEPGDRRVALSALAASTFPEVVDAIVAMADDEDEDFQYEVLRVLEKTAANMEARGAVEAAGRAYLAVYQKTDLPVVRQFALAGVKRCPIPEAYEVLLAEIDTGDVKALPADLLTGLTRALFDQGRTEEAESTLEVLLARATAPHEVDTLIQTLHDAPIEGGLRARMGLITEWQLVGPFDWRSEDAFGVTNINEPEIDLEASYEGKNGEKMAWQTVETPSGHGFVELTSILGAHEHCSAYGFATITLDQETKGHIRVGSDDGIKVWVNGEPVLERNVDRGMALDQDSAPITLREGGNEILVQVTQNLAGWGFVVRLTNEHGAPLSFAAK